MLFYYRPGALCGWGGGGGGAGQLAIAKVMASIAAPKCV